MSQTVIHIYFMPGMAASPAIFEYINLPKDQFEVHLLEWKIPDPNESLSEYAKRMCLEIKHTKVVLVGVSFGGVLVQEMSTYINPLKVIIVSSVKSSKELPRRMKLARRTKAYKLLPTSLVQNVELLLKFTFGQSISKRLHLYKKYLGMRDKAYLNWALHQMMNWKRSEILEDIIHIHGDKDGVFPIKNIENCIAIKGGTHIMIINKYKWFNENLPKLISS